MQSISRRGVVISAATAGAVFGLDGPLEFVGRGFAQAAGGPDVVRFKVGDIEVIQMYDGTWEKAHDPAFVRNASLDDVKGALKAGGLTDAHVPIPFTVTAVRVGGSLVLFDSGTGARAEPRQAPDLNAVSPSAAPLKRRPSGATTMKAMISFTRGLRR